MVLKTGVIDKISRFGGIVFKGEDGVWYNAVNDVLRDEVKSFFKCGDDVELSLVTNTKFDKIRIRDEVVREEVVGGSGGVDWDAKERRTVRQNAGRHASAFIGILAGLGGFDKGALRSEFFDFAREFEEWVYRK